ncbi:MAG TPA: hypothetical protein VK173_09795, partial [Lacibacter sp.]|nr:hypothetical protein [Lacibacter sp.]
MKKILLYLLVFTAIGFSQNSLQNELSNGLWFNWETTVDSSENAESNTLDLSSYDTGDNLTMFFQHRLSADLPDTATVGARIIHLINNYDPNSTSDWFAADTISIDSAGLTYGNISLSRGAYHKLKIENTGYANTFRFGMYFVKGLPTENGIEPIYTPFQIYQNSLKLWVEGDTSSVLKNGDNLVTAWLDKSKNMALVNDTINAWDFTDGWTATSNTTIMDTATFETTDVGGVYKSTLTVGKVYKLYIGKDSNTETLQFGTTNETITVFQLIGTETGVYTFLAENPRLYIRHTGAGVTTITGMALIEVQGNHLTQTDTSKAPTFVDYVLPITDNLVLNGTFDADSSWTKGTGWTISDGKANANISGVSLRVLEQTDRLELNKTYRITYTISNLSAGNVKAFLGNSIATSSGTIRTANGTYTDIITNLGSNGSFAFGTLTFTGSIDDVEVVEISTDTVYSALRFDGTDDYLKALPFTLNQPRTIFIVFKQLSWTNLDYIFDG